MISETHAAATMAMLEALDADLRAFPSRLQAIPEEWVAQLLRLVDGGHFDLDSPLRQEDE